MIYQPVFWCIVFRLEGTEEGLLRSEDLHSRSWVLGETHQASSMADEACTDELANEGGEVGCNGIHAIAEVFGELSAIGGDGDDLVAEGVYVVDVRVGYFCTHGNFGGGLDSGFKVFGQDGGEGSRGCVSSETHETDDLGVCHVVDNYFCEFGEVPAVPFLDTHGVDVDFLVEIVKEGNRLDNHGVDFVGREFDFEPALC